MWLLQRKVRVMETEEGETDGVTAEEGQSLRVNHSLGGAAVVKTTLELCMVVDSSSVCS